MALTQIGLRGAYPLHATKGHISARPATEFGSDEPLKYRGEQMYKVDGLSAVIADEEVEVQVFVREALDLDVKRSSDFAAQGDLIVKPQYKSYGLSAKYFVEKHEIGKGA